MRIDSGRGRVWFLFFSLVDHFKAEVCAPCGHTARSLETADVPAFVSSARPVGSKVVRNFRKGQSVGPFSKNLRQAGMMQEKVLPEWVFEK